MLKMILSCLFVLSFSLAHANPMTLATLHGKLLEIIALIETKNENKYPFNYEIKDKEITLKRNGQFYSIPIESNNIELTLKVYKEGSKTIKKLASSKDDQGLLKELDRKISSLELPKKNPGYKIEAVCFTSPTDVMVFFRKTVDGKDDGVGIIDYYKLEEGQWKFHKNTAIDF